MDRGTRFYTKKSFLGGNFCLQNNQNRKKNRKFQKRRKENGKEKKREDIIRRGGEWIGSSVRVARLAGAPVCRYSRFSPLATYCIYAVVDTVYDVHCKPNFAYYHSLRFSSAGFISYERK